MTAWTLQRGNVHAVLVENTVVPYFAAGYSLQSRR